MKDLTFRYRSEIGLFFKGTLPRYAYSEERGVIRIVNHGNMETLQVEPPEGGQAEIAVRVPLPEGFLDKDKEYPDDKYHGYLASNGYLWGRNTGGH